MREFVQFTRVIRGDRETFHLPGDRETFHVPGDRETFHLGDRET
ncbi:hypothetical protein ACIQUM_36445 [Amycolatopsis azurea]